MTAKTHSEIVGYIGPPGSGKTYKMLRDYASRKSAIRCDMNRQAGMADGAVTCHTRVALLSALEAGKRLICWRGVEAEPFPNFAFAARCAAAVNGNVLLVADECESMVPHTLNMNQVDPSIGYVRTILKRGRHVNVDFVFSAQRPHEVNPTFRSNANRLYVFRSAEPSYKKFVGELAGKSAVEAMLALGEYQCLEIERGEFSVISKTGRKLKKVQNS